MKTNIKVFSLLLMCIVLGTTKVMADNNEENQHYITRNFKVTAFDRIELATVAEVIYTQTTDGTATLQVYGMDSFVDQLEVDLKDGVLRLETGKQVKFKNQKLKITLASPTLKSISSTGVGDILIDKGLKTSTLKISSEGVGNVKIRSLACDEVSIHSQGVGNVELTGNAGKAVLRSEGVGNIDAVDLKAGHVEASSQGVGNITCHATEALKASVEGMGSVKYKGSPSDKKFTKGGFGSIKAY